MDGLDILQASQNLAAFCYSFGKTRMVALVQEWQYLKAVIEAPREVIEQLQTKRRRLSGEIIALRSELEQAKLTMELLNGALRNKGDQSHEELVSQLILRINRLLNPEYFVNAPVAQPEQGTTAFNNTGTLSVYTILISPTESDGAGAEGVYATIRNDYAKDETGRPIFDREFGFWMWGTQLKGRLPPVTAGFNSAKEAEEAAFMIYKTLRY